MVRELQVKQPEPSLSWDTKQQLWHEMVYEEVPLPQAFKDSLLEEYQHLVAQEALPPQHKAAWENYLAWAGDVVEDPRSPRERLEAYFAAQEARATQAGN